MCTMPKSKLKLSHQLKKLVSVIPTTTAIISKAIDNGRPIIEKHLEERQKKRLSLVKLDNVVHLPRQEARRHLENLGFVVSEILAKPTPKYASARSDDVVKMVPRSGKHPKASLIKLFYVNLEVIEASQELIDDETRRIVERNQTIADSFENVKNVIPFPKLKK